MNTNLDETRLALWLEDELHGADLAAFEQEIAEQPALLEQREEARRWRKMMAASLPASEEPPYPDFFNTRVAQAIRQLEEAPKPAVVAPQAVSWRAWFMPLAACAGMVFAFWLGGQKKTGPVEIDVAGAPRAIPVEPIPYVPERGVAAEWFVSTDASATVILLSGVDAIPDSTDFSETVYYKEVREMDSTAGMNHPSFLAQP